MRLERDELAPERDVAREPLDRDDAVERELRDRDDVARAPSERERVVRRPDAARRSEAGISSVATALVSCGSSFVRNAAMRSS